MGGRVMQTKMMIFFGILVCLFFLAAVEAKCASSANWGRFIPSEKVEYSFTKCEVKSDINYYISGSDLYPTAILGLDKSYTLESALWKKVNFSPELLCDTVNHMKDRARNFSQLQFGFALVNSQGKQIGIWYSLIEGTTAFEIMDGNKVMIYQPNQNLYEQYEDRDFMKSGQ